MEGVLADLRYAVRLLARSPGFALVTVLTLALGIGANTAIFSTVDAVLLRALPFGDPDGLAMVWEDSSFAGFSKNTPAPANFVDWKARNRVFLDMAATRGASANLTDDGRPELVLGRAVTPNFFSVLRVQPAIGRPFTVDEDRQGAQVVLISHDLWQRRFAGDPLAIGRPLTMNGTAYTVVGVMPRGFVFRNREIDYWIPAHFTPSILAQRNSHYLNVVARLKPGVTIAQAREEMHRIAAQLEAEYPTNRRIGAVVVPIGDELVGKTRLQLLVLMGAAGAVLLIACANLASLLLSRAVGRRGELGIRAALGAQPGRLVRQLLVEALLLSTIGGLLGLLIAPPGIAVVMRPGPDGTLGAAGVSPQRAVTRLHSGAFARHRHAVRPAPGRPGGAEFPERRPAASRPTCRRGPRTIHARRSRGRPGRGCSRPARRGRPDAANAGQSSRDRRGLPARPPADTADDAAAVEVPGRAGAVGVLRARSGSRACAPGRDRGGVRVDVAISDAGQHDLVRRRSHRPRTRQRR